MQVLILGEKGFLGQYFLNQIQSANFTLSNSVRFITPKIKNQEEFEGFFANLPPAEVIINCVALTNIDYCERNSDKASWVNSTLPGLISKYSSSKHMKLIHFSTDAVFDGSIPYPSEEVRANPLSVYGLTKLAGEERVLAENSQALVIRTNFFGISPKGDSFTEKVLKAAALDHSFTGYSDVYFSPTHARNVVEGSLNLLKNECSGIFHLAGNERISKYEFAKRLFEKAGRDTNRLVEGSARDNPNFSYRSMDLSLDCSKVESYFLPTNTLDHDIDLVTEEFLLRGPTWDH
jgi:dTDP-4-dehydrorhamnose reductase